MMLAVKEEEDSTISCVTETFQEYVVNQETQLPTTSVPSLPSPRLHLLDGTFFHYLPEESTARTVTAMCVRCFPKITKVKGFDRCTSNFLSHLKRKHGQDCVEEYKIYVKRKKEQKMDLDGSRNTSSEDFKEDEAMCQKRFDDSVVLFFIHSMIPLRTVENAYFLKMLSSFRTPRLKIIDRRSLECHIDTYYENQMSKITSELREVDYVCTAIDIWSEKEKNYIGITAHWITSDLRRRSVALACRRFSGSVIRDVDHVSKIIQEINIYFDLNVNKLVAIVTRKGNKFLKSFLNFGVDLRNIDTDETEVVQNESETISFQSCFDSYSIVKKEVPLDLEEDEDSEHVRFLPVHIMCCAHTLNLCATKDANRILTAGGTQLSEIHGNVMKKCNVLWDAAGHPKSAEIIRQKLHHSLSRPRDARWNSLYEALHQISTIQGRSLELYKDLNIKNALTNKEFDYLKEYLACAAPIAEAIDILHSESSTYYGIVLPCLVALKKKLVQMEKQTKFTYCTPLIETYRQSFEARFRNFFDFDTPEAENAAVAALSYPRFKNKWLTCLKFNDRNKVLQLFKTAISQQISEERQKTLKVKSKTDRESQFFNFDSDSDYEESDSAAQAKFTVSDVHLKKAELLMLQFFTECNEELEVLSRYPEIKKVFLRYNTPLPASATVEGLFSHDTMMSLPESCNLSSDLFEKRIVLKWNLNYLK